MAEQVELPLAGPPAQTVRPSELRLVFGGFSSAQISVGLAIFGMIVWGMWVTRSLVAKPAAPIARVNLSAIVGPYVRAQARSVSPPVKVEAEIRRFMATLDRELQRRGTAGQIVLVGEAVLSKNVPDITDSVRAAIYASGIEAPKAAAGENVRARPPLAPVTRSAGSAAAPSAAEATGAGNGNSASESDGTYARAGLFSRSQSTTSSSQGVDDTLALARSYQESARRLHELSQSLSNDASYAETHGLALSENMSQELAQWYRQQQALNQGMDAPELHATVLSDQQRATRNAMIQRWLQEKRGEIRSEIDGALRSPDLVQVDTPEVGSAAEVRASYHPHGVDTIGDQVPPPDGPPAGQIIETSRRELDAHRDAMRAGRNLHRQAGTELQGNVVEDHDRGFFTDPKLRN